jgi:hypothetical protein
MSSYKSILSKLFSRYPSSSSPENTYPQPSSPFRNSPRQTISFPSLPLPKPDFPDHLKHPPRRPRVLVRNRPRPTTLISHNRSRNGLSRSLTAWIRHSTDRQTSEHPPTPPTPSVVDINISPRPSSRQRNSSLSIRTPVHTRSPLTASESCDINLLLSNEPEDAKKAMIKRLEGLAMALDLINVGTSLSRSTNTYRRKPPLRKELPSQQIQATDHDNSMLLSPIEKWEDEDEGDATRKNTFAYYVPPIPIDQGQQPIPGSSNPPSYSCSSGSTLSSCISFNGTDDSSLPIPTVTQYPLSFHLEPISQLTLDICKSTPSPVFPPELLSHKGLVPVENVVISWVTEDQPP